MACCISVDVFAHAAIVYLGGLAVNCQLFTGFAGSPDARHGVLISATPRCPPAHRNRDSGTTSGNGGCGWMLWHLHSSRSQDKMVFFAFIRSCQSSLSFCIIGSIGFSPPSKVLHPVQKRGWVDVHLPFLRSSLRTVWAATQKSFAAGPSASAVVMPRQGRRHRRCGVWDNAAVDDLTRGRSFPRPTSGRQAFGWPQTGVEPRRLWDSGCFFLAPTIFIEVF